MRTGAIFAAMLVLFSAPAWAVNWMPPCPRPNASKSHPPPTSELVAARQAERQACMADMAKFCSDVPSGCGRPMLCLKSHSGELSAACTSALLQLHAASQAQQH